MQDEAGLTRDAFLGGRVQIWQPASGFRAGADSVLLAAACPARSGETVLELGCGAGVVLACLAARVPGLALTGVERNPVYADLARRNLEEAGIPGDVVEADVSDLPASLKARSFDHVIANPPFFTGGTEAPDTGRAGARHEATPLTSWIATAARRLRPSGRLTIILSADRTPEVLAGLNGTFGGVFVRPVAARTGRAAGRILVSARKGGRTPFRLLAPLILHDGAAHERDGDDHSAAASAILRDGAAVEWD
ncbi:methyltransferase [Rhodobacterales bacterium HKCCE3408]|nr:methyltransferase [Rhodobacterales bacterium HKCCE3408]